MKDLVAAHSAVSLGVRELIAEGLSPGSRRTYKQALLSLEKEMGEITDHSLAHYLDRRFRAGIAPGTLNITINAVRFRARLTGEPCPVGPLTERTIAGIRRKGRGMGRGQVEGLQWGEVDVLATLAADGSLPGLRDAALLGVASDALLRSGEVVALQVDDLIFQPNGSALLTIRHSKTDQTGKKKPSMFIGVPTVTRLKAWMEAAKITEGAVFRRVFVNRKKRNPDSPPTETVGSKGLTPMAVRAIVKKRCEEAGFEGRFSGHSLRVGATQSLAENGASLVEMMVCGRWESPMMPAHYAKGQLAARGAVAKYRYGQQ